MSKAIKVSIECRRQVVPEAEAEDAGSELPKRATQELVVASTGGETTQGFQCATCGADMEFRFTLPSDWTKRRIIHFIVAIVGECLMISLLLKFIFSTPPNWPGIGVSAVITTSFFLILIMAITDNYMAVEALRGGEKRLHAIASDSYVLIEEAGADEPDAAPSPDESG